MPACGTDDKLGLSPVKAFLGVRAPQVRFELPVDAVSTHLYQRYADRQETMWHG